VAHLDPRPNVLIFNEGWWQHDLDDRNLQTSIVQALNELNITSIYKTTTEAQTSQSHVVQAQYEQDLCNVTDYCYNLSWTAHVPESYYWDQFHFRPPVYTWMNIQLLELLALITKQDARFEVLHECQQSHY